MSDADAQGLIDLIEPRNGHFELESGHHGELWLDLDALLLRPARLFPFVADLSRQLAERVNPDAICGPLLGGGLVASAVAMLIDAELYVSEREVAADGDGELLRARYTVRSSFRSSLPGRRVAVVDDVINAASATRATVADLRSAGAEVVAIGALLLLGSAAADYGAEEKLALVHAAAIPTRSGSPASAHRAPQISLWSAPAANHRGALPARLLSRHSDASPWASHPHVEANDCSRGRCADRLALVASPTCSSTRQLTSGRRSLWTG